ncbi:MAG TPA: hypothetical protein VNT75_13360 [Symbiobacteriaceae bacterium]|nr:hypothetical protein [Symbiobacteriaceae bacterium]
MKRTLRFLVVLVALLGLMAMTQGAMVGSCATNNDTSGGWVDCPN